MKSKRTKREAVVVLEVIKVHHRFEDEENNKQEKEEESDLRVSSASASLLPCVSGHRLSSLGRGADGAAGGGREGKERGIQSVREAE